MISTLRRRVGRPLTPGAGTTLLVSGLALLAVLLIPLGFSDPNGVDPYLLRITLFMLVLLYWARRDPRLADHRLVLAALAVAVVPFSFWLGGFRLGALLGQAGDEQTLFASLLQLGAAVALLRACLGPRAWMRLRPQRSDVLVVPVAVTALLALFLLIPAGWLGRVAIEPVAISRDAAWLVPAFVLQGAVQELQFRGVLLGALERGMSPGRANLLQALVFALAHLAVVYEGPLAPLLPIVFLLGVLMGWVTQRLNSIWTPIAVHAAAEVLIWAAIVPGLYGS